MRGLAIIGFIMTAASFAMLALDGRKVETDDVPETAVRPKLAPLDAEIERCHRTAVKLRRRRAYDLALAYCNKALALDSERQKRLGYLT